MGKKNVLGTIGFYWLVMGLFFLLFPFSNILFAQESTCARVKIEIKQELTLERQAFDAHMRINNGLTHAALEDIVIEVWFTNEEGDVVLASSDSENQSALFFIRVNEMTNIDNITGSGTVPPSSSSDIHWLIIPATGASNGLLNGTLYNVGATLTYSIGGEENIVEVNPDYIFVKPMPELALDYFLPSDVYGDDPSTTNVTESPIPFSLGLRIKNSGSGSAQNLKIDSAQPKITNDQGLLINFYIQGSQVNGEESIDSLLVDLGTIEPGSSAVARWIMNCTLSGKFTDFDAKLSHADELGGELTSLFDEPKTHTLVRDVLVDFPDRDNIRDFLSKTDARYQVYESDSKESDVVDQSSQSTLTLKETIGYQTHYTLSVPTTNEPMYVKLPDPHSGNKVLKHATRSDGKQIKQENVWLSKVQDRDTHQWDHFVNIFDVNTTNEYTLVFDAETSVPRKPVIQFITDKSVIETQQVSFLVEASDPNLTIPTILATPLPVGAEFIDNGDGTGIFDWTPVVGQKGIYYITFTASDGQLTQSQRVKFIVYDVNDTDMDGMLDDWETSNFQTLIRDGSTDFDDDGISDLQEFIDQTDPTLDESAPSIPDPLYPHPNVDVIETAPQLVIEDSSDSQNDVIDYEFEIYSDPQMTTMVASQGAVAQSFNKIELKIYNWVAADGDVPVPESESTTNWQVPVSLPDNTQYYWRVRSSDEEGSSLWAYQNFFVNTQNDPPSAFQASSPENESDVDSLTPRISVTNSLDIDNDVVTYIFEIFEDENMATLVIGSPIIDQGANANTFWTVNIELEDNVQYYWRAIAQDTNGGQTFTPLQTFYVNMSNHSPGTPLVVSPDGQTEIEASDYLLTIGNSTDEDTDPISYFFEIDKSNTFDSPDKQTSQAIMEGYETTSWQVFGLQENTRYYWRVKANDGSSNSPWMLSEFFVNSINEAPTVPTKKNPGNQAWVDTRSPVLSLHAASDPDIDTLEYRFEVYSNQELTHFIVQADSLDPDWTISSNLKNNTRYYWRAQAIDEHGVQGPWTDVSDFFVKIDLVNETPQIHITTPAEDINTNAQSIAIQWEDSDSDSSATISLYHDTNNEGEDGTLIVDDIQEDQDSEQDSYLWDISAIQDGVYYLYAEINDEDTQVFHYAPVTITIDRTPPVLSVSPEAGEYEEPQEVSIIIDEAANIYYTTDGSDPNVGSSSIYSNPIEINDSVTLKCIAVDGAGNTSQILTQEYIFNLESVTLNLITDSGILIENTRVYVFNESGSYYGLWAKTDAKGDALFDPAAFNGDFHRFRIDYLGNKFWSDVVQLPDQMYTKVMIPVEEVNLAVTTTNGPAIGYRVYLFSETGSYLGKYQIVDENGQVSFVLPVGVNFKFRADVLGTQYWTDVQTVQGGGANTIGFDTGGGLYTIALKKDEQTPISGIKMYLFSKTNSYLGRSQITDENGQVAFEVSEGEYKIRSDYMGYKFWSDIQMVTTDTQENMVLPHKDILITVSGQYNESLEPIEGVRLYLFNSSDSYLGKYAVANEDGQAFFSLPDKTYIVRVDYLGQRFWSQEFNGLNTPVNIAMAKTQVTVAGSGLPQTGIRVYLFSETGAYLGQYKTTDANGQVDFMIPEGKYKFRADYEGSRFWSSISSLAADIENPVEVSVGGGRFTFTAQKDSGQPISSVKCYAFTENNSYIGLYGATDNNGDVLFDLADGTYLFRFDYMGQQLWSEQVIVPDQLSYQMTLSHETTQITVASKNDVFKNTKVYLFSDADSYLGTYQITNDSGTASFNLPVGINFKFRADIMNTQHWSDAIQIQDIGTNQINLDTGGGNYLITLQKDDLIPLANVKLYLFNEDGSYSGLNKTTDTLGQASFEVPQASWKVRADYKGYQFWTEPAVISDDTSIDWTLPHRDIEITIENEYQSTNDPISGIKVYLFNSSQSYLDEYQNTDANGKVVFSLPDEAYAVRADYMGDQFWSQDFQFIDTTRVIPHGIAQVHVALPGGGNAANIRVYLFNSSNNYLGQYITTDSNGIAQFRVPSDLSYKFRIQVNSQLIWSPDTIITASQINRIEMETP